VAGPDVEAAGSGVRFEETWRVTTLARGMRWRTERRYLTSGELE
jgi:hypothetical protein